MSTDSTILGDWSDICMILMVAAGFYFYHRNSTERSKNNTVIDDAAVVTIRAPSDAQRVRNEKRSRLRTLITLDPTMSESRWKKVRERSTDEHEKVLLAQRADTTQAPHSESQEQPGQLSKKKDDSRISRCREVEIQHKILNAASLKSVSDLLDVIDQYINEFNSIHTSTAFHRLAQMGAKDSSVRAAILKDPRFSYLMKYSLTMIPVSGVQSLSNISWALAKLYVKNCEVLSLIVETALPRLYEFKPQNVSNTVYSMSRLGFVDRRFLDAVAKYICSVGLSDFKPQEVSNSTYAFARLNYYDQKMLSMIGSHLRSRLSSFNPNGVSNTLHALSRLGYFDRELMKDAAKYFIDNSNIVSPATLASLLLSFGMLKVNNQSLFDFASDYALRLLDKFSADELVIIITSMSQVRYINAAFLGAACKHLESRLTDLCSQRVCYVMNALAKVSHSGVRYEGILRSCCNYLVSSQIKLSYNEASIAKRAICNLGFSDEIFTKAMDSVKDRHKHSTAVSSETPFMFGVYRNRC